MPVIKKVILVGTSIEYNYIKGITEIFDKSIELEYTFHHIIQIRKYDIPFIELVNVPMIIEYFD